MMRSVREMVDQGRVMVIVLAMAAGLGATSMMRPSVPRSVPAVSRASMYGASLATLPVGHDPEEIEAWDEPEYADDEDWDEPAEPTRWVGPAPELTLIATAVRTAPAASMAMLRREGASVSKVFWTGDRVDGWLVETVARREVVLTAPDGRTERYRLSLYPEGSEPQEPEPIRRSDEGAASGDDLEPLDEQWDPEFDR